MAGRKKGEWDVFNDLIKIIQQGQLKTSMDKLAESIVTMNTRLTDLNILVEKQNTQVAESLKTAKENIEELRKGFEGLNKEFGKASSFFEDLRRSSTAMENMTIVIGTLTFMLFILGLYDIVRDLNCVEDVPCDYSNVLNISVISGIILFLVLLAIMLISIKIIPKRKIP